MTRRITITSTSNDRLKAARRLGRGRRRGESTFLVEGHRNVRAALEAGADVRELFAAPELFLGPDDPDLVALAEARGARVYEVRGAAFRTLSAQVRPDGLAAVVERWPTSLARLAPPACPLVLVAEAIERPGNLGTIVRTACAAGADALIVCEPVTDVFHASVVRGSAGTLFSVRIATASTTAAIAWLRERAVRLVVTSPAATQPYWAVEAADGVAVIVGSERHGVSEPWLQAADAVVSIPMPGAADSLNVAVAAGIVLFEAARTRPAQNRDEGGTHPCA
jgi:RNA methyltransferase, TrmH family